MERAAWMAALRAFTATTGLSTRMAASKGSRYSFSYGKTRKLLLSTLKQTPAWTFSSDGLNHASPCVWSRDDSQHTGRKQGEPRGQRRTCLKMWCRSASYAS